MDRAAVTVMGGGIAGLSAALLLARHGHRVRVLERDPFAVDGAETAFTWRRPGIAHFHQPHAFIPRGRLELRAHLADVYATLLVAGAEDVDVRRKLPGPPAPGDEDLQYFAVRRPLLEWALRRAVQAEPAIEVLAGVRVSGIVIEGGRVTGVRVDGSCGDVELLVDALGRRTPTPSWLSAAGVPTPPPERSDCGVTYYSRYYRLRPGFDLPDGPWLLSPRGDLGYFGFASFPGDNRTFAAVLAVPPGVPEWRVLKDPRAFEAAVARLPALRCWVEPEAVDPITDVLPMAGLQNTLRHDDPTSPVGLAPVGDAFSHTDPTLAHGLSFALVHALELANALAEHADLGDALSAYAATVSPALRERYDLASALDAQRYRMWTGEAVDFTCAHGAYALFSLVAAGAVAAIDAEVFRVFVRRIGLLDSTAVLDRDEELQRRIERLFAEMRRTPRPPAGPGRDEMVELTSAAVAG